MKKQTKDYLGILAFLLFFGLLGAPFGITALLCTLGVLAILFFSALLWAIVSNRYQMRREELEHLGQCNTREYWWVTRGIWQ